MMIKGKCPKVDVYIGYGIRMDEEEMFNYAKSFGYEKPEGKRYLKPEERPSTFLNEFGIPVEDVLFFSGNIYPIKEDGELEPKEEVEFQEMTYIQLPWTNLFKNSLVNMDEVVDYARKELHIPEDFYVPSHLVFLAGIDSGFF